MRPHHQLSPQSLAASAARTSALLALTPDVATVPATFEPVFNPAAFAVLLAVVAAPFGYWWLITVPEARINLAKDKRLEGSDVQGYLSELKDANADERLVERWFFAKWLRQLKGKKPREAVASTAASATQEVNVATAAPRGSGIAGEVSTPVAATSSAANVAELFRPVSNVTPRFWSGDNPIVVTLGGLLFVGVLATIARENSSLALDLGVLAVGVAFGVSRLGLK